MWAASSSPEAGPVQKMHSPDFGLFMYSRRQGAQRRCSAMGPALYVSGSRGCRRPAPRKRSRPDLPGGPLLGQSRQRAVVAVEGERLREIDVGDAVGVGDAERAVGEALTQPADAPARGSVEAGVDALDPGGVGPLLRARPGLDLVVHVA